MSQSSQPIRGRGTALNPPNRFESLHLAAADDPDAWTDAPPEERPAPRTRFYRDFSQTILSQNDSPDIPFTYSVNVYRGCEHGCVYCYARPTHEYLGFSAGLDFETRILVKTEAPALLRQALAAPKWKPQPITMSGVTDPYQPIERKLQLTRQCLALLAECRNPVSIITKNHLVTRDLDLLGQLARFQAARVHISVTTLDPELAVILEPRTSTPARRLAAIRALRDAGVPVTVLVAPVIPGLTDHELPAIAKAVAAAGATSAYLQMLRLPLAVGPLFEDWLQQHFPDRKAKVLAAIKAMRGGKLNDPRFGSRMRGSGLLCQQTAKLFAVACRHAGLDQPEPELSTAAFRRPEPGGQLPLL